MSDADFRDLVGKMRAAQTRYFETRDASDLRASKDYERRVDVELAPKRAVLFGEVEAPERVISFRKCARCGGTHERLPVRRVPGEPIYAARLWAICPITAAPILVEVREITDDAARCESIGSKQTKAGA